MIGKLAFYLSYNDVIIYMNAENYSCSISYDSHIVLDVFVYIQNIAVLNT